MFGSASTLEDDMLGSSRYVPTADLPARWYARYGVATDPAKLWRTVRSGIVPVVRIGNKLHVAETDVPALEAALGLTGRQPIAA
jgi:hypothetical protein